VRDIHRAALELLALFATGLCLWGMALLVVAWLLGAL
jgi:hypothetical protein